MIVPVLNGVRSKHSPVSEQIPTVLRRNQGLNVNFSFLNPHKAQSCLMMCPLNHVTPKSVEVSDLWVLK